MSNEITMAEISVALKDIRESLGLHPEQFAVALGVRYSTYRRYENADRNMSVPNIRTVATWARTEGQADLFQLLARYALGSPCELSKE